MYFLNVLVEKFPTAITFWSQEAISKAIQNLKFFKEREHWIFKIAVNLKEIISLVPPWKCLQNVDNFPNLEGLWTLS